MTVKFTQVEQAFLNGKAELKQNTNIPFITVDNFPKLGFLTALRFLEW
jgi:glucosamine-6-phosphate deaminase